MWFRKNKPKMITCPVCDGKGYTSDGIWNEKCVRCEGAKKVEENEDESKTCGTCGCRLED